MSEPFSVPAQVRILRSLRVLGACATWIGAVVLFVLCARLGWLAWEWFYCQWSSWGCQ